MYRSRCVTNVRCNVPGAAANLKAHMTKVVRFVSLLTLLLAAPRRADSEDLFSCDGRVQDHPCENQGRGISAKIIDDQAPEENAFDPEAKPEGLAAIESRTNAGAETSSSASAETVFTGRSGAAPLATISFSDSGPTVSFVGRGAAAPAPAATVQPPQRQDIRKLITERPEPDVKWRFEELSRTPRGTECRVSGSLTGAGSVRVTLLIVGAFGGRTDKREVWSKLLRLRAESETTTFTSSFFLPVGWVWVMRAENHGRFEGYRDIKGCCARTDGTSGCSAQHVLVCPDGSLSPNCGC